MDNFLINSQQANFHGWWLSHLAPVRRQWFAWATTNINKIFITWVSYTKREHEIFGKEGQVTCSVKLLQDHSQKIRYCFQTRRLAYVPDFTSSPVAPMILFYTLQEVQTFCFFAVKFRNATLHPVGSPLLRLSAKPPDLQDPQIQVQLDFSRLEGPVQLQAEGLNWDRFAEHEILLQSLVGAFKLSLSTLKYMVNNNALTGLAMSLAI